MKITTSKLAAITVNPAVFYVKTAATGMTLGSVLAPKGDVKAALKQAAAKFTNFKPADLTVEESAAEYTGSEQPTVLDAGNGILVAVNPVPMVAAAKAPATPKAAPKPAAKPSPAPAAPKAPVIPVIPATPKPASTPVAAQPATPVASPKPAPKPAAKPTAPAAPANPTTTAPLTGLAKYRADQKALKEAKAAEAAKASPTTNPEASLDNPAVTTVVTPPTAKPTAKPTPKPKAAPAPTAPTAPAGTETKPEATTPTAPKGNQKKDGLRKPQERIISALAKAGKAMDRKTLAVSASVDPAMCTEYLGSTNDAIRVVNDTKHFPSLLSLGLISQEVQDVDGKNSVMYSITDAGLEAVKAIA